MSGERLAFCFGVHNHQPVGNFDHVVADATARAYHPFLERLAARSEVRLSVHCSGSLLEWLREHAPRTFDLLGSVVARGQVELLTGGFYEPILAVLPDHDKAGQIERLTDFLKTHFGVRPRGMWLAERVWEPHLPRALVAAGVEYVLVDDRHFALAGLEPETLGGYYLTDEQGALLAVFPISQRLRYLIPFADVEASLEYLAARRGRVATLTLVDDGEKFGVWPGTHARVYGEGWLDRFFDRLLAADWLELTTFADVRDRLPATGRVYLPTASYREMGEWALPAPAARFLEAARARLERLPRGDELAALLRGGFWRHFLAKYPEVADVYWKMLRLSHAIHRARETRPEDPALAAAQLALWRGQANDAYWHGIFGGCYLPHLRRAVRAALLDAERRLADATGAPAPAWTREDGNGDGREEVYVRTRALAVTLNPEAGGTLTELGFYARGLDVADVLARRPEAYHDRVRARVPSGVAAGARTIHEAAAPKEAGLDALLDYDDLRRASLLDGLFAPAAAGEPPLDPVAPWAGARLALGAERFACAVRAVGEGVEVTLTRAAGRPLDVEKRVTVRDATVEARYRLRPAAALAGRFAVQWNLALTAGDAPGRYLTAPERPSLGSAGRLTGAQEVSLVDEWAGVEARLEWAPGAELAWGPVQTVSLSEDGFERIYQGTALLLVWPVDLGPAEEGALGMRLTLAAA
ncbi:MAG: hypothetical protein A2W08_11330 [Candidatus Rokubacteria bacterium RBG_16_73_20]|nr:MAG: hypothetical protein A2W08_11330 [Candidatus Rokubacteria bacterium RBG_16_73_20]